jgi:hypothetical protein
MNSTPRVALIGLFSTIILACALFIFRARFLWPEAKFNVFQERMLLTNGQSVDFPAPLRMAVILPRNGYFYLLRVENDERAEIAFSSQSDSPFQAGMYEPEFDNDTNGFFHGPGKHTISLVYSKAPINSNDLLAFPTLACDNCNFSTLTLNVQVPELPTKKTHIDPPPEGY